MILFQLYFEVETSKAAEFEKTYREVFLPALSRQPGFQRSELIRVFPPDQLRQIESPATELNYQVNFIFESEEQRRVWARSPDHDLAWPKMRDLAKQALWRGYDVI